MPARASLFVLCSLLLFGSNNNVLAKQSEKGVQVTPNEAQRRVDITINGQPFTSYVWPTSLKKPVLFPLIAPGGTEVTRGYGLFAANPLGRKIFDPKQPAFNYTIEKGQSATFRYRVLLYPRAVTPEEMNHQADVFASDYR